jgi:cytochrome c-type biogenesis protein CcmF
MYFGFTGAAYDTDKEAALRIGESLEVRGYTVRYDGSRMETDPNRRMIFTDLTVMHGGERVARVSPAKFIYSKPMDTATSEVAIHSTLGRDVYAIMNTVNPQTKVGTFRVIVRPFVAWIWLGGLFIIFGTFVCMSPSVREVLGEASDRAPSRRGGLAMATSVFLVLAVSIAVLLLSASAGRAQSDGTSSLHAGSVTMHGPVEKQLFERLLCMCGDCQRLPLSTCSCGWADDARVKIREKLASNVPVERIQEEYRAEHGARSIAIPSDKGLDRALWAVPIAAIAFAAALLVWRGRVWMQAQADSTAAESGEQSPPTQAASERYDAALDAELKKLDD